MTAPGCPQKEELLVHALREPAGPGAEGIGIGRHLDICEECRHEVMLLRGAAAQFGATAPAPGERGVTCLTDLEIAALVDGQVTPVQRPSVMTHLATCGRCRADVAALSRLRRDPEVDAELGGLAADRSSPRWVRALPGAVASAVAAAAVLVLLLRAPSDSLQPTATHREPVITSAVAPIPVAPANVVGPPLTLVWTSVPGADRYEASLFDEGGTLLWRDSTPDTTVALPPSLSVSPGQQLFWKVRARVGWDRWTESALTQFVLAPPSPGSP